MKEAPKGKNQQKTIIFISFQIIAYFHWLNRKWKWILNQSNLFDALMCSVQRYSNCMCAVDKFDCFAFLKMFSICSFHMQSRTPSPIQSKQWDRAYKENDTAATTSDRVERLGYTSGYGSINVSQLHSDIVVGYCNYFIILTRHFSRRIVLHIVISALDRSIWSNED